MLLLTTVSNQLCFFSHDSAIRGCLRLLASSQAEDEIFFCEAKLKKSRRRILLPTSSTNESPLPENICKTENEKQEETTEPETEKVGVEKEKEKLGLGLGETASKTREKRMEEQKIADEDDESETREREADTDEHKDRETKEGDTDEDNERETNEGDTDEEGTKENIDEKKVGKFLFNSKVKRSEQEAKRLVKTLFHKDSYLKLNTQS